MKAKYINILVVLAALCGFSSCSEESLNSESIFDTTPPARTEFDKWLKANYTDTYNIEFNYLYNDKLSDLSYNVVPAKYENSVAMSKLMKHVWMDAYAEVAGPEFLKKNCFRQIQLIGSPEFDSQGSIVLGTAEGGLKVLLFRLNELDPNDLYINQDNPYRDHYEYPLDLNYWYFHTMHHEFCHILTQQKNYSTEYQLISAGKYHSADWINVDDIDAPAEGFVSGYASGEANEDFAEMYSTYVTSTPEYWQKILDQGVVEETDADGNVIYELDSKGNFVYEYEKDEEGNYVYEQAANGSLVPETDDQGNIIYQTDKDGNYVYYVDKDGYLIPASEAQVKALYYYDPTSLYWIFNGELLNVTTHLEGDPFVYQTNNEGEIVYDKDGNPVPEYYRIPVFALKKHKVAKVNTEGRDAILQKLEMVKSYFSDQWGIDLEEIRKVVTRRSKEIVDLDVKTIN